MARDRRMTKPIEKLLDLATKREWTIPDLRNRLAEAGLEVPLPTLRSWRYGKRQPSPETAAKIASLIPRISNDSGETTKKLIRLRVTPRQIEQAAEDHTMTAIAVSGVRASKAAPLHVSFFESPSSPWLPLADVNVWQSHVKQFAPDSMPLFLGLFRLLANSPGAWLQCMATIRPLENEEYYR